jgi:hypothetical protein
MFTQIMPVAPSAFLLTNLSNFLKKPAAVLRASSTIGATASSLAPGLPRFADVLTARLPASFAQTMLAAESVHR